MAALPAFAPQLLHAVDPLGGQIPFLRKKSGVESKQVGDFNSFIELSRNPRDTRRYDRRECTSKRHGYKNKLLCKIADNQHTIINREIDSNLFMYALINLFNYLLSMRVMLWILFTHGCHSLS